MSRLPSNVNQTSPKMKLFIAAILRGTLVVSALALGMLTVATARAADAEERGVHFADVAVPEGLAAGEVKDAIVGVLIGRQWRVKSKSDSEVVGYLKHRSNEATVTMTYDTTKVSIYCVGYEINKKTGERKKPEQPAGWLKFLHQDLLKTMNTAISLK